jgi:hypothetical protein
LTIKQNNFSSDFISSPYLITHHNGKILILNTQSFRLYQLLEGKERGSPKSEWALSLVYDPDVKNFRIGKEQLSLATVDTSDQWSPLVVLMTKEGNNKNQKALAMYSLDTHKITVDSCKENPFCVSPATCQSEIGALQGYRCECPAGYILEDDYHCVDGTLYNIYNGESVQKVPIISGSAAGFIFLVIAGGIISFFLFRTIDVSILPKEICWTFKNYFVFPLSWRKRASNTYYRILSVDSSEYQQVTDLFYKQLHEQ